MNAKEFADNLRVINCLSGNDFELIFGSNWKHFADKFFYVYNSNVTKFICYLDNENVEIFMKYVNTKRIKQAS